MRSSAVKDCLKLFNIFNIDPSVGTSIDVGGTRHVSYDGIRDINPLHRISPAIKYLDKGFNIETLNTEADMELDFLNKDAIIHMYNEFDIVYSFDTLQYIPNPMLFFEHIAYISKPGGYIFISTVFNWQYQKDPEDYFRFTPFGLLSCFNEGVKTSGRDFKVLWCWWESTNKPVGVVLLAYNGIKAISKQEETKLEMMYKHK